MPMHRYGTLEIANWVGSAPASPASSPTVDPQGVHFLKRAARSTTTRPTRCATTLRRRSRLCLVRRQPLPESPVGPFHLAEVRIAARVGPRPPFSCCKAFATMKRRGRLASRWAIASRRADRAEGLHYQRAARRDQGADRVDVLLTHREPLPAPAQPTATVNPPSSTASRLAGLSIEANFQHQRCRQAQDRTLDGEACPPAAHAGDHPMRATIGVADWVMGAIEFTVDPSRAPNRHGIRGVVSSQSSVFSSRFLTDIRRPITVT